MRRTLIALATAVAFAAAVSMPTAPARADGGATAAWVIGSIAVAGLLLAATYPPPPAYAYYGPYAYAPGPRGPVCYWTNSWDGWGWRRVRVCY